MVRLWGWLAWGILLCAGISCSDPGDLAPKQSPASIKEQEARDGGPAAAAQTAEERTHAKETFVQRAVVVPEPVLATWKKVTLRLSDLQAGTEEERSVVVGSSFRFGTLDVMVAHFVPSFTMTSDAITSASNELDNPAAELHIRENGELLYANFIFSKYPDSHPFDHSRYKVLLVGVER